MPNLLLTMWDTIKSSNIGILVAAGLGMFAVIGGFSMLSYHYTLSGIKSRTVGDGQHGTARWATDKEIRQPYAHVPFKVRDWRKGQDLPSEQGLVLGCKGKKDELTALVDSDDIHCLMIAASGAGKTAFFLYPNLEYACASGMSFLALDTKGDLARNYGSIAKKYYGYKHISVIDLRNPTRSDGNNLLTLINRYMDIARKQPDNLAARAKAEKYAKILAKSIVSPEGNSDHGQNAFFYDAAEGLLSSTILLLAEFLPPDEEHRRSGGTSCRYSSWCRICWSRRVVRGDAPVSSCSWTSCRPSTKHAGWQAPHSTAPSRRWHPSCPRCCPVSIRFLIVSWSRSCASTVPLTLKCSLPRNPPSSSSCRRRIRRRTLWLA